MDTATKESESSQQKLDEVSRLLEGAGEGGSAAPTAALQEPVVTPDGSITEHNKDPAPVAVAPVSVGKEPVVTTEINEQSKTHSLKSPLEATTEQEPGMTENSSQKKPPPPASVVAVVEKSSSTSTSSSNLKKPPPTAPSVAAAAVSNVARMPSSSDQEQIQQQQQQQPDSCPIPDHLENSFHNFATILAIVWPELFMGDCMAPMAPVILLAFLHECDIVEPAELGIFGEDVLDEEGDFVPTDEDLALSLFELPCWEDPLETGRSANARRQSFQTICTFIGNHGEEEFREFVGELMECNLDSTEIILMINDRNTQTFKQRCRAKDMITDMMLMSGDNDESADLQAALAASLLDQSKLAAKKGRDDDNDESSQPASKKQRETSPTSVDDFASHTNSTANPDDVDSDDGGGKIGAVRDLQKAHQHQHQL